MSDLPFRSYKALNLAKNHYIFFLPPSHFGSKSSFASVASDAAENKNKSKNIPQEISVSRFLVDCGSDSSILNAKDFAKFGLSESGIRPCGRFSLKGSTGTVED